MAFPLCRSQYSGHFTQRFSFQKWVSQLMRWRLHHLLWFRSHTVSLLPHCFGSMWATVLPRCEGHWIRIYLMTVERQSQRKGCRMRVLQSTLGYIFYLKYGTRLESPGEPRNARKSTTESITEEATWDSKNHTQGRGRNWTWSQEDGWGICMGVFSFRKNMSTSSSRSSLCLPLPVTFENLTKRGLHQIWRQKKNTHFYRQFIENID